MADLPPDFLWRAEEACRHAWPSRIEMPLDGWLLRRSGGQTKRTNSVNPLPGPRADPERMLERVERFYRDEGQRPIFRIPDLAPDFTSLLDWHGYERDAEALTLLASAQEAERDPAVTLSLKPDEAWLSLRDSTGVGGEIFRTMLGLIRKPAMFASLRVEDATASIAYGVLCNGLLVIESVVTAPSHRNRGLARRTVGTLMHWARGEGVSQACLQVAADNVPAQAVYRRLGFARELYRYHYRLAPEAA